MRIQRVVSGGQTGADRGAFDAALRFGIEVGGWVPRGRLDENGLIPGSYPNLVEAETENPAERTELNIRSSDATLILSYDPLIGGSELTRRCAAQLGKPWKHVNLAGADTGAAVANIIDWLSQVKPLVLNVAGPRASEDPRIYDAAKTIMEGVFMDRHLQILLDLRASVLSQCCGWDQIRWQVPSWFCTLGTVSIGVGYYLRGDAKWEAGFSFVLGVFGFLCFVLLYKLVTYENRVVREFNDGTMGRLLPPGDALRDVLKIRRPFDFTGVAILRTATFWFLVYTALLADGFLLGAACMAWVWRHRGAWVVALIGVLVIAVVFETTLLGRLARRLPSSDGERQPEQKARR